MKIMRWGRPLALALSVVLSGCASPWFDAGRSETVLPLSRAWFEGQTVEYIATDASDAAMAHMMGINYVPRLADTVVRPGQRSVLERVYKFEPATQLSVFQSAPRPAGAENTDRAYSPLWRVVWVRWLASGSRRELRSEEEVLAAEERGEVALDVTDIVVNCPVTRSADGRALRGVR